MILWSQHMLELYKLQSPRPRINDGTKLLSLQPYYRQRQGAGLNLFIHGGGGSVERRSERRGALNCYPAGGRRCDTDTEPFQTPEPEALLLSMKGTTSAGTSPGLLVVQPERSWSAGLVRGSRPCPETSLVRCLPMLPCHWSKKPTGEASCGGHLSIRLQIIRKNRGARTHGMWPAIN
jgi:hypothetical protein